MYLSYNATRNYLHRCPITGLLELCILVILDQRFPSSTQCRAARSEDLSRPYSQEQSTVSPGTLSTWDSSRGWFLWTNSVLGDSLYCSWKLTDPVTVLIIFSIFPTIRQASRPIWLWHPNKVAPSRFMYQRRKRLFATRLGFMWSCHPIRK